MRSFYHDRNSETSVGCPVRKVCLSVLLMTHFHFFTYRTRITVFAMDVNAGRRGILPFFEWICQLLRYVEFYSTVVTRQKNFFIKEFVRLHNLLLRDFFLKWVLSLRIICNHWPSLLTLLMFTEYGFDLFSEFLRGNR